MLLADGFGLACLNLDRTDLRGARFRGTPLLPLCLRDAEVSADLTDAFLLNATLTGAILRDGPDLDYRGPS